MSVFGVILVRIQSKCGKIRTSITPNKDIFDAVESRTHKAISMEIFVSTTNDSQPLTVVIKNFSLDATGVLDPHDKL